MRPRVFPEQDAPMDSYTVRLPAAHARFARRMGDKNLSVGVRVAIEAAALLAQKSPLNPIDQGVV